MNTHALQRRQLSDKLKKLDSTSLPARPAKGWIKTIRTAMGMTSTQLASRLGVNQSQVSRLEQAEANNTITLKTLKNAAAALNCEVVYELVPKTSIEDALEQQTKKYAMKLITEMNHHMMLEQQTLSPEELNTLLLELIAEFSKKPPKDLWEK